MKDYSSHYAFLGAWLGLGMILILLVRRDIYLRMIMMIIFAAGYVVWGVVHHLLIKDFHSDNVLEYMMVALLSVVMVGGLMMQ